MKNISDIKIKCNTEYDLYSYHGFIAQWHDDKFRYHVWLRANQDGTVSITDTIYKNKIEINKYHSTIKLNLRSKVHEKLLEQIDKIAQYDELVAIFDAYIVINNAFDAMHAEAAHLNKVYDAWRTLRGATTDDLKIIGVIS